MTRSGRVSEGARRVDARTERWRAHRERMREEFVDAAFRALDAVGPGVSMGDIAREAGAAKPKLYRHFEDKTDLYDAVVDRMRELLWTRITASVDLTADPVRVLVRRAVTEYVLVVDEHPNVFRFLLHSHFTRTAGESERALRSARRSARWAAELLAATLDDNTLDVAGLELVNYAVFGAVASGTDWWLGATRAEPAPMPLERFVAYLTEIVTALAEANARLHGITLDPASPLALAVGRG